MNGRPKIITVTLNPCIDRTVQVCAFLSGQTNTILSAREEIGGKGLNVSRTLRNAGQPVLTAGLAPESVLSQIQAECAAIGSGALFIPTKNPMRINLKIMDVETGEMTELNEPGVPVDNAPDALWKAMLPYLPHCAVLALSGSLPPETDVHLYANWIADASAFGVKTVLDTSGEALRFGVNAVPWAIKPNRTEFESLVGCSLNAPGDAVPHIRRLLASGIGCVAVSLGADGALFARGGRILLAKPFPIRVGSCAAAGDSMTAMLCLSAVLDLSLEQTARLACAAGTLTASKEGTQTATAAEAADYADQIELTEWI